jgi:hypothetical protein
MGAAAGFFPLWPTITLEVGVRRDEKGSICSPYAVRGSLYGHTGPHGSFLKVKGSA